MPKVKSKSSLHNLPGLLSTFVGRDREIAEVKQQFSTNRLLTLTGPGGCGKTRLALQVAAGLLGEFEDGVWFVELAPLADPLFVPQALASILGVSEGPGRGLTDALADHFLHLHALVVLDNCEHLIGACAQLADSLLQACPDLSILATSSRDIEHPRRGRFCRPASFIAGSRRSSCRSAFAGSCRRPWRFTGL